LKGKGRGEEKCDKNPAMRYRRKRQLFPNERETAKCEKKRKVWAG